MPGKQTLQELESLVNHAKQSIQTIKTSYENELLCYQVLALSDPNAYEEKRNACQTKLNAFNQGSAQLTLDKLDATIASLVSLKELETTADAAARDQIKQNIELEKWLRFM